MKTSIQRARTINKQKGDPREKEKKKNLNGQLNFETNRQINVNETQDERGGLRVTGRGKARPAPGVGQGVPKRQLLEAPRAVGATW